MGKATVYSHLGDGKYSILYTPEVAESAARIAELEALKTALDAQLYSGNGLIEAKSAAQEVYDAATWAFELALADWTACAMQLPACPDQAALISAVSARGAGRAEAGMALNTVKAAIAANRSEYFSTTQEIAYLQNTQKGSGSGLMQAWCIDFDQAQIIPANTVVGTVETFGAKGGYQGGFLPRKWVNIQSSAAPAYSAARDHCVKPVSGIKTAAMFFNWCQWLYVMSHNPQHAVGMVLSKFNPIQTYLDVELYGTTPGAYQPGGYPFDGDNKVTLLNVPVSYLTCGAEVFEEGDKVIVRFSGINRSSPTVIGFAENPAECQECAKTFLWPYHGLAMTGFVVRPDETTKPVLQPTGGNVVPIYANASAAIFSGSTSVHCGDQSIGNKSWLWIQSPTSRVKVQISGTPIITIASDGSATATLTLVTTTVTESPVTFTTALSIALTGDWDNFNDVAFTHPFNENIDLEDVSKYGENVILRVKRNPSVGSTDYHREDAYRGFLLLTMTSPTSATITTLADLNDVCPVTDTYMPESLSDVPYCYWFAADDSISVVTTSYSRVYVFGEPTSTITFTLYLDGVLQDTCIMSPTGVTFSGGTIAATVYFLNFLRSSESSDLLIPWNITKWLLGFFDYTGGLTPISDEYPYARGTMFIKKYTNKSCGFCLELFRVKPDRNYRRIESFFGNIIHPPGPADPGTKIGTKLTAEFICGVTDDVMHVTSISVGSIAPGASATTAFGYCQIVAQLTGATGSTGTYRIDRVLVTFTNHAATSEYIGAPFSDYTPETGIIQALETQNRPYTSYQPITGQLIRNRALPICYV